MSATDRTAADFEAAASALVHFRVRCEGLSHGEEVFLVPLAGGPSKSTPLYTTASLHPWYHSLAPLSLTLPPRVLDSTLLSPGAAGASVGASVGASTAAVHKRQVQHFAYRLAVHRAGIFHRWEEPSDGPTPEELHPSVQGAGPKDSLVDNPETAKPACHEVPLHLMADRETYVVNDVLGLTNGPPDMDRVRLPTRPTYTHAATLHSHTSEKLLSAPSPANTTGGPSVATASPGAPSNRKHVGFAASTQAPASYQPRNAVPKQAVHLNSTDGLVVVSIFLPVILHRSPEGEWSADWDYEMLLSMQTHLRVTRIGSVKWRGWHGNTGSHGSPEAGVPRAERHKVEECLRRFNCVPVWIDPVMFGEMYNGFCKGVLWPVLHNVTSVYSSRPDDLNSNQAVGGGGHMDSSSPDAAFSEYSMDDVGQGPIHGGRGREAELWSAYNNVNRQIADAVVQYFNEGDLVWVHGFHLLILPSYLTRRIPMAKIGMFLHTPFPSSEIFRTLWCREDLLRGMLNADQVGFHLFEYARHFLTSCRRLLGLNYGMIPDQSGGHTLAIDTNGRHVVVTSIHAGVEPPVLNQILSHRSTMEKAKAIRNQFQGKHIWCAIDRLESLKGIPLKLLALERFLKRCPEWIGKIVLVQVGISAFERGEDYHRTKHEVLQLVQNINSAWPGTVQFQECRETEMKLHQRIALLRAADLVVVTSIRDGLNLLPLEYTIAHQDALSEVGRRDGRKRGLCILSEFASCTRVMRGALHINPWKISEIANAFHVALNMSEDERLRRISIASEFVTRVTTQRWALAVMLDLKGVQKNINPVQVSGAGLGLGYRILGMNTGFKSLDTNVVAKAYRNSRSRLILVDFGGTIVSNDNLDNLTRFQMVKRRSAPSTPTSHMIAALKGLCSDKRNTVFVVSGKERHSLTKTLGNVPNLGLAAEHGMFISWPTSRMSPKRRWETLVPETDRTWRSLAITIMEVYTSRTHGSYIEETEMKVLWQYRDADTEFGSLQAKELEDHLSKYLRSFPVDILHGGIEEGGYVEVRPKGVNKGVLAMRVLKRYPEMSQKERVDFALVLGDDHCDEPMLSVMRQIGRRVATARRTQRGENPLPEMPATIQLVDVSSCDSYVSPELEVFSATVGKKPSAAANYLHDVAEVQELLDSLVKVSTRDHQFYSAVDLRAYAGSMDARTMEPNAFTGTSKVLQMQKSLSLDQLQDADQPLQDNSFTPEEEPAKAVSTSLQDFLGLGTIDDEEDDEAFFF